VRQKISTFKNNYPQNKLKAVPLGPENHEHVIHFIGAWRREKLVKGKFSYSNLEKNKFAARYYSDKNDLKDIWAYVYKLRERVVGFQLLYRLGSDSAGHAIGLADPEIKGLSEHCQIDIWKKIHRFGIRYVNDGPSWRPGLDRYKQKFNPITTQQVFECKI
jgi:hypothetical protein